jgi:hypothetical protein
LLSLIEETCEIQLNRTYSTPATFCTTQVKPYFKDPANEPKLAVTNATGQSIKKQALQPDSILEEAEPTAEDTIRVEIPTDPLDRYNPAYQRRLPNRLAGADLNLYLLDDDNPIEPKVIPGELGAFAYTR